MSDGSEARVWDPTLHEGLCYWQRPTALWHGLGALGRLGWDSKHFGEHALLVTDQYLAEQTEIVSSVQAILATASITSEVFSDVEPHPSLSCVQRGVDRFAGSKARMVIGVGGGSSMDVAKCIAASARNPSLIDDEMWISRSGLLIPELPRPRPAAPLLQVPTSAGTSSEVNCVASVVADELGKKKLISHGLLYARSAFVDPKLTFSLSRRQTAEGSLETLCRTLIPYITDQPGRALQDRFSEGVVDTLLEYTPQALETPTDLEARTNLSLAAINSTLGWVMIGRQPFGHVLWYLSNALGLVGDISKSRGMAALLPAYLKLVLRSKHQSSHIGHISRLADMGKVVFGVSGGSEWSAAEKTAREIEKTLVLWDLPTSLEQVGIEQSLIHVLADETLELWGGNDGQIGWLSKKDLLEFYSLAL